MTKIYIKCISNWITEIGNLSENSYVFKTDFLVLTPYTKWVTFIDMCLHDEIYM